MNSTATANNEPLPGYIVTERIGSGGYGEVWKATAPGGVEKAVKTLYGYHDEELASREMKALERIKGVRHPFLLSLDRFEVVDGRLIVVTELAEMSLDDCFQQYRREGQRGIPRHELLSYLRDAADALDYMHQHHGLQHLDVKPENLLILGGHVKVADFGLVKEIGRATQNSLVGGMTPTYAAPELFDNRPCPRTDQYSLAIVFQEMLTGTLPFPGRTPAQLVAQHTQAAPRVAVLSEQDQQVILRALAKDPNNRFASCSEFMATLAGKLTATAIGIVDQEDGTPPARPVPVEDDTKDVTSNATEAIAGDFPQGLRDPFEQTGIGEEEKDGEGAAAEGRRWMQTERIEKPPCDANGEYQLPDNDSSPATARVSSEPGAPVGPPDEWKQEKARRDQEQLRKKYQEERQLLEETRRQQDEQRKQRESNSRAQEVVVSTETVDAAVPEVSDGDGQIRPTLMIGVGGQGANVLERVCGNLQRRSQDAVWRDFVPMLALDTDRSALRELRTRVTQDGSPRIDTLHLPLKQPQHYREKSPDILEWLNRRWFYNIPRSLETRGFRPLGRLALIDNARWVVRAIEEQIGRLTDLDQLRTSAESSGLSCQIEKPRIVIVASTTGGTGSGGALDLALAVKRIAEEKAGHYIELIGFFGDCSRGGADSRDLALANTYAFLNELYSTSVRGNRGEGKAHEDTRLFEGDGQPFDHVYFSGRIEKDAELPETDWVDQVSEYLTTDIASGCGAVLDACRGLPADEEIEDNSVWTIRSFVASPLEDPLEITSAFAKKNLYRLVAEYWRAKCEDDYQSHGGKDTAPLPIQPELLLSFSDDDSELDSLSEGKKTRKKGQPEDPHEMLRRVTVETFGDAANSVFVAELVAVIGKHLQKNPETDEAALNHCVHRPVQMSLQALTDVVCRFTANNAEDEAISARCLRAVSENNLAQAQASLNEEQTQIVAEIGREVCVAYFSILANGSRGKECDLSELLVQAVDELVVKLDRREDRKHLLKQFADHQPELDQILQAAVIHPSQCGHVRRSIVVLPEEQNDQKLVDEIERLLPDAAIARGGVTRPLLVREASGLSLAQVASRLIGPYPEIVEVARRLQTRRDIELSPLPRAVSSDDANPKRTQNLP